MATPAELFRAMADRIDAMNPAEFAGAILVVPPAAQGNPSETIEVLTAEGTPNLDHFWGMAKVRVDTAVAGHQQEILRRQTGMGYR